MTIFLFPSDYFRPTLVDEMYLPEATAFQQAGFPVAVVSLDSFSSDSPQIRPSLTPNANVIYRGWMLGASDYQKLVTAISQAGACIQTSSVDYLATHYLPNWYHSIKDLTPETHFYHTDGDLESDGIKRIVEIGDGQVSGLVGWTTERFVEICHSFD